MTAGLLLIDKPKGPSSHSVVSWARWALGGTPVGHAGTLDPDATGMLVCLVGAATRLNRWVNLDEKRYVATIYLGLATDTDDLAGDLTDSRAYLGELGTVETTVRSLSGARLELPPPAYSAVHVDGKRAYELARAGQDVELARRPMQVLDAEVISARWITSKEFAEQTQFQQLPQQARAPIVELVVDFRVSKGTYIRSLAVELGRRLGAPCVLGHLCRTESGRHRLEDASCVRGLSARELEPRVGHVASVRSRKPRWRISLDATDDRCATGELLQVALRPPWAALSIPCHDVSGSNEQMQGLRDLCLGKQLGSEHSAWARLSAFFAESAEFGLYCPSEARFVVVKSAIGRRGGPVVASQAVILRGEQKSVIQGRSRLDTESSGSDAPQP